jgi:deoxyribose-phosphate aldolase
MTLSGDRATTARVLAVIDHTRLGDADTPGDIDRLCREAASSLPHPAAVCVWPEFIVTARRALDEARASDVAVAAVVNFPDGSANAGRAIRETRRACGAGAQEIDLVFPWRAYVGGDREIGPEIVRQCREAVGDRILKVIVETGELGDPHLIRELTRIVLDAGADFVKTSTGKTRVGATLEAARVILECIHERGSGGLKASGGIRTHEQARAYLELADDICGSGFATPRRFRLGSSSLLGSRP